MPPENLVSLSFRSVIYCNIHTSAPAALKRQKYRKEYGSGLPKPGRAGFSERRGFEKTDRKRNTETPSVHG
jgi:hypothetical protein